MIQCYVSKGALLTEKYLIFKFPNSYGEEEIIMESTDNLGISPLEKAMLTARKRINLSDPAYHLSKLDIVMYLARRGAGRYTPPVVSAEYLSQLRLGTVYGTD
jgi:hypothetical protein